MRIQHNIMAMNAYRNYTNNVSAMQKNLEKLSSGYKINRAGDDAAGLAISEKMRAQISGLETAQKNAKDGISLVQTAEGALTEVHDMLNRMVTLATQSANGTYDNTTDRNQMQKELDQLRDEINRIADSSNFNGINLLDGGGSGVKIADAKDITSLAGAGFSVVNDGQLVDKEPTAGKYSIDFSQLKLTNSSTTAIVATFQLVSDVEAGITIDADSDMTGEEFAKALAKGLQGSSYSSDVGITFATNDTSVSYNVYAEGSKLYIEMLKPPAKEAQIQDVKFTAKFTEGVGGGDVGTTNVGSNAGNQFEVKTEVDPVAKASRAYGQASFTLTGDVVKDGSAIKIGDTTYVFAVGKDSKYKDYANVIDLTDQSIADSGISKQQLQIAGRRLTEAAADNKNFYVGTTVGTKSGDTTISLTEKEGGVDYSVNNLAGADGISKSNGSTSTNDAQKSDWKGLVTFGKVAESNTVSSMELTLQIGDTADSFNQLKVNIKDMHTKSMGIADISIADQESAQKAVEEIKKAINYVSDVRGTLGATQNRLDHTINNLSVMTENIQDAESTIRDVDVAEEMMAYTKNNILIQSAQAMLAQANQVPQGVLQLLG